MTNTGSQIRRIAPKRRARPLTVLFAVFGIGLALGACSKCDVPSLFPNPSAPRSCHDGPPPQ